MLSLSFHMNCFNSCLYMKIVLPILHGTFSIKLSPQLTSLPLEAVISMVEASCKEASMVAMAEVAQTISHEEVAALTLHLCTITNHKTYPPGLTVKYAKNLDMLHYNSIIVLTTLTIMKPQLLFPQTSQPQMLFLNQIQGQLTTSQITWIISTSP